MVIAGMFNMLKNERGVIPMLGLITVVGVILFLIASATLPFHDRLFTALYPKDSSHAASYGVDNPTRLAIPYVVPRDRYSGAEFTPAQIAQKFSVLIYHRQFNQKLIDYRNAGFKGEALQYIIHDEIAGPVGLNTVSAQATVCSATQKNHKPAWENNVTAQTGEFCQIHDSIVNKSAFDHDLNPNTPEIVATEDWFLHRKDNNERMVQEEGMPGGIFYRINPANQNMREYFIGRALRELKGGANFSKTNFDGVFLDNIQLSWNKVLRTTAPKEFSGSDAYSASVRGFVGDIYSALHTNGNTFPLWGNMIEGADNGTDWDQYLSILDGGLHEHFALNWGYGIYDTQTLLNQYNQAEKWLAAGKHFIAIGQGSISNSNFDNWGKFALASFLLVTDGTHGSFVYANMAQYGPFYDYSEYYYKLGSPLTAKYQVSSSPLILRRDFECGKVEVNLSAKTSVVSNYAGCIPSAIAGPTIKPLSTTNPTPLQTFVPTPVPTPVPSPVPTYIPTSAPNTSLPGSTVKIDALGTRGKNGKFAKMDVKIDGKNVKTFSVSPNLTGYTFTAAKKISASQVKVGFWDDDGPRDLTVLGITIDGTFYPTATPTVYYYSPLCKMNGFNRWNVNTLWCNGDLTYR